MKGLNQQRGLSFVGLMALVCVPLGYLFLARVGAGPLVFAGYSLAVGYLLWPKAWGLSSDRPSPAHAQSVHQSVAQHTPQPSDHAQPRASGGLRHMPDFVAALAQSNRIKAETAKSALLDDLAVDLGRPHAMAFVRSVEVYGESLGMVNSTKNVDTLRSRCNVGLQTLEQLSEQYPAIMALLRDAMGEDMIAAAGDRMAALAEEKVAALCAKAFAAKTDATRDKHIAAAKAKAEELIALGYLTPNQVAALRASIQKHLAPKAAASATAGTLVIPLFTAPDDDPDVGKVFVLRSGKSVEADAAFFGWSSGDIDEMRAALHTKTNPIDRHHLLQELVRQTYRLRKEPAMAKLCSSTAETYLQEFPKLYPVLRADWGGPHSFCQDPRCPKVQASPATGCCSFERAPGADDEAGPPPLPSGQAR